MAHGRIFSVSCLYALLLFACAHGSPAGESAPAGGTSYDSRGAEKTVSRESGPRTTSASVYGDEESGAETPAEAPQPPAEPAPEMPVSSLAEDAPSNGRFESDAAEPRAAPAPAKPASRLAKKEKAKEDARRLRRERDRMEGEGERTRADSTVRRVRGGRGEPVDFGGPPGGWRGAPAPIAAPAMRAGRHDDNKQYNRFLSFLAENSHMVVYPIDVSERLTIRTLDEAGKSLHNCRVEVKNLSGKLLSATTTFADGSTQFFPSAVAGRGDEDFTVRARCGRQSRNGQLSRLGRRDNELRFTFNRSVPENVPVDIAIVLDTTGSMQSQIDRLKKTLKAIHFQLTNLPARPDIRFALVAYRDQGDDYVTKPYQFTTDVRAFQRILDSLDADGGGDTPEDLQAALEGAMKKLEWRDSAVRVGFIVADAIPHTDYGQAYNYRSAMRESLERGIKWVAVGAGGLPREGEVIFRQIAQYTMGEYVFITESGAGDHEGGIPGEASHHVGSNYTTENLDQAIIRIVRREISYLTDAPKDFDDTIVATAKPGVPRDTVLAPAVAEVLRQLVDYSAIRLDEGTAVAVVPTTVTADGYADVAGYITDQMVLSASRSPALKVVERDLQAISKELELQLSDIVDVEKAVPLGKMIGAELLIVSKLTVTDDGASLFAKLVRVETGEVLSVAKVDMSTTVVNAS